MVLVSRAVLVASVVQVDRVEWAASVLTGPQLYRLKAALAKTDSAIGSTTPFIAVARLIRIGVRPIALEAALAEIHLANARPAPDNKLLDRVEGSMRSLPLVAV